LYRNINDCLFIIYLKIDAGGVFSCGEGDLIPRHIQDLEQFFVNYVAAGHGTSAAITGMSLHNIMILI
jgi:hypothetical protein